ncbi:C6 transcription factor [Stagonosporopsis vannaccii]|nr:C6 transcription factor [Stagonosporopsis vannaccii]
MEQFRHTPRGQRTLLPAPPDHYKAAEHPPPKRTKLNSACGECRARKTKCDGSRPKCQACTARLTVCEYLPTESRQGKERARISDELLRAMKESSDEDAINILRRIRAGAEPDAVVRQIHDGNLLMQLSLVPETRRLYDLPYTAKIPDFLLTPDNPYIPPATLSAKVDLYDSGWDACYTKPYHAAVVSDPLIDRVSISRWTTVISSNELLRQLLRTFFQFAYAEWFPVHKDLFLLDMAADCTDFCSPLLVNAVLANACYSSASLPNRAKYWLPDNLTYRFTAEAKRLWDLEVASGRQRLTTIQASQILSVIMDFDGINSLGRFYTAQGLSMAQEIGLFGSSEHITCARMRKARLWTAWSLFSWHSMISYYFHACPSIPEPPRDNLPDDPSWYGEIYLKYAPSEVLIPVHLYQSFKAKCRLRCIKHAIATQAFGNDNVKRDAWLTFEEADQYCTRLEDWAHELSGQLQPSRVVFPKDIGTHIEYLSVITDLLSPHASRKVGSSPNFGAATIRSSKEPPAVTVLNADRQKETLLRAYYLRHSFDNFDPMLVNFIIERLGASISGLRSTSFVSQFPDQEILRSTLILCATGLRSQAKSYHVCTLAYFGLQSQMRPADIQLLLTYTKPPADVDMPPSDHDAVTSWPLPIISMSEDPKKSALNKMVKDYEKQKSETDSETTRTQACPLSTLDLVCHYDVGEGVTRAGRFKVMKDRQLTRSSNLERLVELLREGDDMEASTVLARLRLGDHVADILHFSQSTSIDSTPETTVSQSRATTHDSFDSVTTQSSANVEPNDTTDVFLSLLFDLNDLRFAKISDTDVILAKTGARSLVSSTYFQSQEQRTHNTTVQNDFILAQSWKEGRSGSAADPQACLTNFFGNMPFSSGILANHHSHIIQEQQLERLSTPMWALMCINHDVGPKSITMALTDICRRLTRLLKQGDSWETLVGAHPHVAALSDSSKFATAPLLSQWAASMVHSIKNRGDDFTCVASMYLFWYIASWIISPSPETYEAMPKWIRPTPYQIFVPHSHSMDFLLWPMLRDLAVQRTTMQEKLEWLFVLCTSVRCEWPLPLEEALCMDSTTGEAVFTDAAKAQFLDLANWSAGLALRAHIPNADLSYGQEVSVASRQSKGPDLITKGESSAVAQIQHVKVVRKSALCRYICIIHTDFLHGRHTRINRGSEGAIQRLTRDVRTVEAAAV